MGEGSNNETKATTSGDCKNLCTRLRDVFAAIIALIMSGKKRIGFRSSLKRVREVKPTLAVHDFGGERIS